jgi:hypothetical protein
MLRRLSLAFLSIVFVYGLSISVAPGPALAARARVNCDVGRCIDRCFHMRGGGSSGYGQLHISSGGGCTPNCLKKMDGRKKAGLCP